MIDPKLNPMRFRNIIKRHFVVTDKYVVDEEKEVWINYNGHDVKLECETDGNYKMHGPNESEFANAYFPDKPWFPNTYRITVESEGLGYRMCSVDFWNEDTRKKFISGLNNILKNEFKF